MKPEMKELYKIKEEDRERTYQMMIWAFRNYPKLVGMFTEWDDRQAGIEMTLRYYGAFDFMYVMYFPESCEPWTSAEAAHE